MENIQTSHTFCPSPPEDGELPRVIQIVGPTASGKTAFSVDLAEALGAELINVDSMQVYRPLAVGTDKPDAAQCARVPIHGIDLIDFGPPMDASEFAGYAHRVIREISARHRDCVLSGGTGLYHRAIVYGLLDAPSRDDAIRARLRAERDDLGMEAMFARLQSVDPGSAAKIYPTDWVRIERALEVHELTGGRLSEFQAQHGFKSKRVERLALGCARPRAILYEKIDRRLDEMWRHGILDETRAMIEAGLPPDCLPMKALGYRQAYMALTHQCSFDDALELAKRETRRFAKRQLTWFRADRDIEWIDMPVADFPALVRRCRAFLKGESQ